MYTLYCTLPADDVFLLAALLILCFLIWGVPRIYPESLCKKIVQKAIIVSHRLKGSWLEGIRISLHRNNSQSNMCKQTDNIWFFIWLTNISPCVSRQLYKLDTPAINIYLCQATQCKAAIFASVYCECLAETFAPSFNLSNSVHIVCQSWTAWIR